MLLGNVPPCSAGERDDGQLAIVQEEPEVRTIAVKLAGDVAEVIDACGNGRRIWKAWNIHAMKDAGLHHERALPAHSGHVKRTYDGPVLVDVVREGISRTGKPEMGELAAAKKKSYGMKIGAGAAAQRSDDGIIVIEGGG